MMNLKRPPLSNEVNEVTAEVADMLSLGRARCNVKGRRAGWFQNLRDMTADFISLKIQARDEAVLVWLLQRVVADVTTVRGGVRVTNEEANDWSDNARAGGVRCARRAYLAVMGTYQSRWPCD